MERMQNMTGGVSEMGDGPTSSALPRVGFPGEHREWSCLMESGKRPNKIVIGPCAIQ